MKTRIEMVALDLIRIDGGTQSRVSLNTDVVAEYAEATVEAKFPPIIVYFDGTDYWLADGFHRYFGHQKAGLLNIECDIRNGSSRDAILFSVGANAKHGLKRTNADKQKAVNLLLVDPEWSKWSDREIARKCSVSDKTVAAQRAICGNSADTKPDTRTVKRGDTVYQQKIKQPDALPEVKPAFTAPADDTPEIMRGYSLADEVDSPEQMLADAAKENEILREQLAALTADDTSKELEKQIRMRVGIEARLQQEMNKNAALGNELKYFGDLTRNIRNALGVADNKAIVAAIRAMTKAAA